MFGVLFLRIADASVSCIESRAGFQAPVKLHHMGGTLTVMTLQNWWMLGTAPPLLFSGSCGLPLLFSGAYPLGNSKEFSNPAWLGAPVATIGQ